MTDQRGTFHVGVVVRQAGPMLDFYSEVLGLEYVGDLDIPGIRMKVFAVGDAFLKLLFPEQPPSEGAPGGLAAGVAGLRYLTIQVPDVAGAVARCRQAGVRVPTPAFEYEPGVTVAIVEDPDGNSVELINKVLDRLAQPAAGKARA